MGVLQAIWVSGSFKRRNKTAHIKNLGAPRLLKFKIFWGAVPQARNLVDARARSLYWAFLERFVHMSDHTGVVHSCAPVLEHMHDHLSCALMWSALMTLCPCLKKRPTPVWSTNQPHTGVVLGICVRGGELGLVHTSCIHRNQFRITSVWANTEVIRNLDSDEGLVVLQRKVP